MSLGAAAADGGSSGGTSNTGGGAAGAAGAGAGAGSGSGGNTGAGSGSSDGGNSGGTGNQNDKSSLGTGNAGTASWRDSLPDDLKADPTLSKYSDLPNLAKAHIELQKKFGQKGIFKPGKDASPEEIKSFREAMGIPTDATKYELGQFEGVQVPKETIEWAQKMGVEHGVEPAALKSIITEYFKIDAKNSIDKAAATKNEIIKGLEGLKTEWGAAFNQNLTRANFAAEKLGGKGLVEALKKYGADNDPVILKAFAEASKLYGDDKLREAGAGSEHSTPAELDAQIAEVQTRLISLKPTDGAYLSVKAKFESLWKQKTNGK